MVARLLAELRASGVMLSIGPGGRLAYDAPAGAINDELMARMRAHRDELLATIECVEESAAIAEHDGGMIRSEAESMAWAECPGVICPGCRSGTHMIVIDGGLYCQSCQRDAWRFDGDAIVRCDWSPMIEMVECEDPRLGRRPENQCSPTDRRGFVS